MRAAAWAFGGVVAACLAAHAQGVPDMGCRPDDRACNFALLRNHAVHRAETWADALRLPLEQRIAPAPPLLVQALTLDNRVAGFREVPRSASVDDAFAADVRAVVQGLPAPVRRILGNRLAGIYLVEELGGTGFTNTYRGASGSDAGAYVVLDVAVLAKRRANEWATWKENTPFTPAPGFELRAVIEPEAANDRRNAIRYILLHEMGHVASVGARVHPPWTVEPREVPAAEEHPFFRQSWRVNRAANRFDSVFDADFPRRREVVYYLGARLDASEMARVYGQLEKTNFPTLYAATHPSDDFAEAFANYVHVVMEKRPFEILILENGRVVKRYGACWDEARCAAKRRILETLLAP